MLCWVRGEVSNEQARGYSDKVVLRHQPPQLWITLILTLLGHLIQLCLGLFTVVAFFVFFVCLFLIFLFRYFHKQ